MLSLDQVRLLENRVEKAVERIQSLTSENTHLRTQLTPLQARVNELEGLVRAFKDDQGRIEEGILNALDRLSAFEDSVYTTAIPTTDEKESVSEIEITETEHVENNVVNTDIEETENIDLADTEWETETPVTEETVKSESTETLISDGESNSDSDGQMDIF